MFKKIVVYILLFSFLLLDLPQSVLAVDPTPIPGGGATDRFGFITGSDYLPPDSFNYKLEPGSGLTMTWTYKPATIGILVASGSGGLFPRIAGFRYRIGQQPVAINCGLSRPPVPNLAAGTKSNTTCGTDVIISVSPMLTSSDVTAELEAYKTFSAGTTDLVITLTSPRANVNDYINKTVTIGFQPVLTGIPISYGRVSKTIAIPTGIVPKFPTTMATAFSDENIEGYIANRIALNQRYVADHPNSDTAKSQATDEQEFTTLMRGFKNTASGHSREIIKLIESIPGADAFQYPLGKLLVGLFLDLKNDNYDNQTGITTDNAFHKEIGVYQLSGQTNADPSSIIGQGAKLAFGTGTGESCQEVVNKLSQSSSWVGVWRQVGAAVGAGATFGTTLNVGWTLAGAASGAVIGSGVDDTIQGNITDAAEQKISEVSTAYAKILYGLSYIEYGQVKLGLMQYASEKDRISPEVGLTVQRLNEIGKAKTKIDEWLKDCTKNLTGAADSSSNDACSAVAGKLNSIMSWVFCEVSFGLYQLMTALVRWGNNLAAEVIGVDLTR